MAVKILVTRIDESGTREYEDEVAEEFPLQVVLNGQPLVTMMCSPGNVDWLAVGFLASEGLIGGREDIREVVFDREGGAVEVVT
ncbi:formate dehydrogenase accessory sulfurtransferase FdhD, partial [Desulforudis sp. 1190]